MEHIETQHKESNPSNKGKSIHRSAAYPAYKITTSFEKVKKIYSELGGTSHHNRDAIGKVLGLADKTVQVPLSSAVQYGLLEVKPKAGYKVTPLFIHIYKPENEAEKTNALLQCLKNPKLYSALLREFKGHVLPSIVGLSTTLFRRYSIAENASERAAQVFLENLKELNLITADRMLVDIDSQSQTIESEKLDADEVETEDFSPMVQTSKEIKRVPAQFTVVPEQEELPIYIPLKNGKKARLFIPENITNEDLDKISRFIEALRE